jgi:release factor H-coupled RctB family protein
MTHHNSIVEEDAMKQLEAASKLPKMCVAVGMPDLHPGKGYPIGASCGSFGVIYPHLVGNDIGCGMALYQTSLKNKKKINLDKWAEK